MRLIDADALKKAIARLHVLNDEMEIRRAYAVNPHATATDFEETLVSVFDDIDDAPTIDAVSVDELKAFIREQYFQCDMPEEWGNGVMWATSQINHFRNINTDRKTEPQYSEDDMYWLSLAEDVANGKMSDAGANQAWLEYINHKDEPRTDCPWK